MAYKDLLVVLDADQRVQDRILLAVGLAERFGAHLVGLYVAATSEQPGRSATAAHTIRASGAKD
jgi:hypothetical protein